MCLFCAVNAYYDSCACFKGTLTTSADDSDSNARASSASDDGVSQTVIIAMAATGVILIVGAAGACIGFRSKRRGSSVIRASSVRSVGSRASTGSWTSRGSRASTGSWTSRGNRIYVDD